MRHMLARAVSHLKKLIEDLPAWSALPRRVGLMALKDFNHYVLLRSDRYFKRTRMWGYPSFLGRLFRAALF
jgi:hypothetical protein